MSELIRMNRRLPRHRTLSRRQAKQAREDGREVTTVALEVRSVATEASWNPLAAFRAIKRARNRVAGPKAGTWTRDREGNVRMVLTGGRNRRTRRSKRQSPHLVARRQRHKTRHGRYTRSRLANLIRQENERQAKRSSPFDRPSLRDRACSAIKRIWNRGGQR